MSNQALLRWRRFRDAAAGPLGIAGVLVSLLGIVLAIVGGQYAAGTFWLVFGEIVSRDQERYLERREADERRYGFSRRNTLASKPRP